MIAIDTSILVYAFDSAYPKKRKVCSRLLQDIFQGKTQGVVTNQILAEFAAVVRKKVEKPLAPEDTQAIVASILASENWHVYEYTAKSVLHALSSKHPFWDALIVQTLHEHNIQHIITENTKHFSGSGIKATNPFV